MQQCRRKSLPWVNTIPRQLCSLKDQLLEQMEGETQSNPNLPALTLLFWEKRDRRECGESANQPGNPEGRGWARLSPSVSQHRLHTQCSRLPLSRVASRAAPVTLVKQDQSDVAAGCKEHMKWPGLPRQPSRHLGCCGPSTISLLFVGSITSSKPFPVQAFSHASVPALRPPVRFFKEKASKFSPAVSSLINDFLEPAPTDHLTAGTWQSVSATKPEDRRGMWGEPTISEIFCAPVSPPGLCSLPAVLFCTYRDDSARCFPSGFTAGTPAGCRGRWRERFYTM